MGLITFGSLVLALSILGFWIGFKVGYDLAKKHTLEAFQRAVNDHKCTDACPRHPVTIRLREKK